MDTSGRAPTQDGPTHHRVAENVRTLRQHRRLSQADLSRRLSELGTPIGISALSKIENGSRRVTVDDLVALAIALDVSPNRLLLPGNIEPQPVVEHLGIDQEAIALTPTLTVAPTAAWAWAVGEEPLPHDEDPAGFFDPVATLSFVEENQPHAMPDAYLHEQVQRIMQSAKERQRAARRSSEDD